jgi:hypothetical protein
LIYKTHPIFCHNTNFDALIKSQKTSFFVIPAKAGIQCFQKLMTDLNPGFRRGDDFLRVYQFWSNGVLEYWIMNFHHSTTPPLPGMDGHAQKSFK